MVGEQDSHPSHTCKTAHGPCHATDATPPPDHAHGHPEPHCMEGRASVAEFVSVSLGILGQPLASMVSFLAGGCGEVGLPSLFAHLLRWVKA